MRTFTDPAAAAADAQRRAAAETLDNKILLVRQDINRTLAERFDFTERSDRRIRELFAELNALLDQARNLRQ